MNKFTIQLSLKNHQIENYVNALKNVGAKYSFFSLYSDTNLIDNLPLDFKDGNYITFAAIKALKLSRDLKPEFFENIDCYNLYKETYYKSFFYDDNLFDQKNYKNLDLPMINKNCEIISLKDNLDRTFEIEKFIKPTSDLKGFVGGIIKPGVSIEDFILNSARMPDWINEVSLISDIKEIHSEYRFFVVNNKVITGSRYMLNKEVLPSEIIPESVLSKAHELAKAYTPERVFTMDLGLLSNGEIEIVEYNCFNGSGTYYAPLEELMLELMNLEL
jgi:hypothetical protein